MKAIFFDFFGVLSTPPYSPFIKNHIPTQEQPAWLNRLNALDLGEVPECDFIKQLSNRTHIPEAEIWATIDGTPQPDEELYAFIQHELKGTYTIGLLTNAPRSLIDRIADERLALFDVVIVSSDVKLLKPDPRIFELAIHQGNAPAHEVIFVDDRTQNVEGAQHAGMQGIVYTDLDSLTRNLSQLSLS